MTTFHEPNVTEIDTSCISQFWLLAFGFGRVFSVTMQTMTSWINCQKLRSSVRKMAKYYDVKSFKTFYQFRHISRIPKRRSNKSLCNQTFPYGFPFIEDARLPSQRQRRRRRIQFPFPMKGTLSSFVLYLKINILKKGLKLLSVEF